jgi:hypothetical protein
MKWTIVLVLLFCLIFENSFAQFNAFKLAPEVSIDYSKSTHIICTANVYKLSGAAGSPFPYVGMDNFGLGLGLSIRNQTANPELVMNYTKTIYIVDLGVRSKLSLNMNQKYLIISPTIGVSLFGFFGAFYSYNVGDFSSINHGEHSIGIKYLFSSALYKKEVLEK